MANSSATSNIVVVKLYLKNSSIKLAGKSPTYQPNELNSSLPGFPGNLRGTCDTEMIVTPRIIQMWQQRAAGWLRNPPPEDLLLVHRTHLQT